MKRAQWKESYRQQCARCSSDQLTYCALSKLRLSLTKPERVSVCMEEEWINLFIFLDKDTTIWNATQGHTKHTYAHGTMGQGFPPDNHAPVGRFSLMQVEPKWNRTKLGWVGLLGWWSVAVGGPADKPNVKQLLSLYQR